MQEENKDISETTQVVQQDQIVKTEPCCNGGYCGNNGGNVVNEDISEDRQD